MTRLTADEYAATRVPGGHAVVKKYGARHMRAIGRRGAAASAASGGRRLRTLAEILSTPAGRREYARLLREIKSTEVRHVAPPLSPKGTKGERGPANVDG